VFPAGGPVGIEGAKNGGPRGARENSYTRLDAEAVEVMSDREYRLLIKRQAGYVI
jgi:hypothetical protein